MREATGMLECGRQHQPSFFNTQPLAFLSASSALMSFYLGLPYHQYVNVGTLDTVNVYKLQIQTLNLVPCMQY